MDILGIDLGTTNSVATIYKEDNLEFVSFDNSDLLPSVVNISDNGVLVGQKAKNIAVISPEDTIISIKRKMGSEKKITLNSKDYSPEEISSLIIRKIKEEATEQFGSEFSKCVITVPAYFNEIQREATAKAAKLANLEPIRILNEPTAAALSYGANKDDNATYAIYDLGGGTFDVSIIENSEGVIEVLSTMGDNNLGGDDFDEALANLIWEKSKFDIEKTRKIQIKLQQLAEKVKIELSTTDEVKLDEKFFAKQDNKALHLEVSISKKEFEDLISESIDKTVTLLIDAIDDANIEIEELKAIILTGGSSRIPLIAEKILKQSGVLPVLIDDPDKAVAVGAILQGAMIEGKNTDSFLIDITPYSLGTDVLKDNMVDLEFSKIIMKNTPIPTAKTNRYYAAVLYQKRYEIVIFQGESMDLNKNIKIGEVELLIENPPEYGKIDVTFSLDIDGILNVKGIEINTGEVVEGQFKSKISHTTKHSQKNVEVEMISEHDKTIIARIDTLLKNDSILDEDKDELKELKEKFLSEEGKEKEKIEEEIIDSIFFLEEE